LLNCLVKITLMKNVAILFFVFSMSIGLLSLIFPNKSPKNTILTSTFNQAQSCVYTYVLEAKKGLFTVSLLPNQTIPKIPKFRYSLLPIVENVQETPFI